MIRMGRQTKTLKNSRFFSVANSGYDLKCANALFASAILCVSSFFLTAVPVLLAALINSSANLSFMGNPFFLRADSKIQRTAKACPLSFTTGRGTW